MFQSLSTMLPYIYTGLIMYPFLFGYGLFSKKKSIEDERRILFMDFNTTSDNTNIYYKNNVFSLTVESDFVMIDKDIEMLNTFNEPSIKYEDIYSKINELRNFMETLMKKNKYNELCCIVSSNAYNLLNDMFEENEQIKMVDVRDNYGIFYNGMKDIPMNIDEDGYEEIKKEENQSVNTHAEYLYNKIADIYSDFPDCYYVK